MPAAAGVVFPVVLHLVCDRLLVGRVLIVLVFAAGSHVLVLPWPSLHSLVHRLLAAYIYLVAAGVSGDSVPQDFLAPLFPFPSWSRIGRACPVASPSASIHKSLTQDDSPKKH